jgi:hypothetical protein
MTDCIFLYHEGDIIYCFTQEEAKKILDSGKNPYTGNPIYPKILKQLRNMFTEHMRLLSTNYTKNLFEIPATIYQYIYYKNILQLQKGLLSTLTFEKDILNLTKKYKEFGFCLVSDWILPHNLNKQLIFYLVVGDSTSMEKLEEEGVSCNLDEYSSSKALELRENCPKKFPTIDETIVQKCSQKKITSSSLCFTTGSGNCITYPYYPRLGSIPTLYDFVKQSKEIRQEFWTMVANCIQKNVQRGKKFQLTLHVGPCNQQGNPQFHVKVGPSVGECSIGRHPKLQLCKENSIGHYMKNFEYKPVTLPRKF